MRKKLSRTEMAGCPTTRVLRVLALSLKFKNLIAALNRQAVRHLTIVSALLLKYANLVITKSIKITKKIKQRRVYSLKNYNNTCKKLEPDVL